ncbi:hypothetical protein BOTBODRAFT_64934 [Botryobasidium botryosum FD-172 SS1]|uniref:RGS domain-containing protein n=1 Tax=Botryobasidium botryosum (strain FD-172 SS1) TaxID=930990 RepID=A0A067MXV4_BOTB1|nr:hypothetical protein BOTBODRAFT_64934 [Botryobasidium botryosum FD-172 SS1]
MHSPLPSEVSFPTRPPPYPYSFSQLLSLPRRLLRPPQSIGKVRSCHITPYCRVELLQLLNGKYLPPLGLKEFEEYLLFEEQSAENLYFFMWLLDYTKSYETRYSKSPSSDKVYELRSSLSRAHATFFTAGSRFELNVVPEYYAQVDGFVRSSSLTTPDAFNEIREQVESMLTESLNRFVTGCCTNSGRYRGLFGIVVGLAAMSIALAPVLLSILGGESRWVRFAALPCLWFGAMVVIASLHGICVVIYLFGDARQLYPYELARPSASVDTEKNAEPMQHAGKYPMPPDDEEAMHGISISPSFRSDAPLKHSPSASPTPTSAGFISPSPYLPLLPHDTSPSTHSVGPATLFDFDTLPSPLSQLGPEALAGKAKREKTPMFGPLTRVLSPEITRAQWEIVIRSAILGVFVAIALGAVCIAVPAKSRMH